MRPYVKGLATAGEAGSMARGGWRGEFLEARVPSGADPMDMASAAAGGGGELSDEDDGEL
jgi:hypothetical protein